MANDGEAPGDNLDSDHDVFVPSVFYVSLYVYM